MVYINAVVTDRNGNAITDLAENDFSVFDDGVSQRIGLFSPVDSETSVTPSHLLGLDTYSNWPSDYGAPPSVTVLLFDRRWTSHEFDLNRVRDFLRQIQSEDHIGIYVLGDDLQVVHNFTRDTSDLVSEIRRYDEAHPVRIGGSTNAGGSTGDPALDHALADRGSGSQASGPSDAASTYEYADTATIDALEAIAAQLAGIPGRRELIWVANSIGPGAYLDTRDMAEYLRLWREHSPESPIAYPLGVRILQMVKLMNRAAPAIYTVDARSLQKGRAVHSASSENATISPQTAGHLFGMSSLDRQFLMGLPKRTGGRAVLKRSELQTAIQRAVNDARFSYNLVYSPAEARWKGEWRNIKVKVDRAGATVLARTGYVALPDDIPSESRTRFLHSIAASPLDSTQLPFRVHIVPSQGGEVIGVDVEIPSKSFASILAPQPDGHWTGRFEVMFMQLDASSHVLDARQKQIDADLTPQEYAAVSKKGWSLPVKLPIKPGAQRLCVILHDEVSDAVGSIHIPLASAQSALNVQ